MKPKKALIIIGTRPEAIKLAPLIKKMKGDAFFMVKVCSTGQHREMLAQALKTFSIVPDYKLNVMKDSQGLADLTSKTISALKRVLSLESPDLVVVQGDTTTAFASALASFYNKIPVAHVEAGLRTDDKYNPFPEELNRRLIGAMSDLNFAPTRAARGNLLREGIAPSRIFVTGNTVVDALELIVDKWERGHTHDINGRLLTILDNAGNGKKVITVTCHRRESFGKELRSVCSSIKRIARRFPDTFTVFPVHMNPNVRKTVFETLKGIDNISLIDPLDYESFLWLVGKSYLVITDSGGVQEEAPSLRKPVLVIRKKTERLEGLKSGITRLVGTSSDEILRSAADILNNKSVYRKMTSCANPYGDGKASYRIIRILKEIR